jgi:hypothetical protein
MACGCRLPGVEDLAREWPEEMDGGSELIEEYASVLCAILDIPVEANLAESFHVLFTLYQRFRECGYFADAKTANAHTEGMREIWRTGDWKKNRDMGPIPTSSNCFSSVVSAIPLRAFAIRLSIFHFPEKRL